MRVTHITGYLCTFALVSPSSLVPFVFLVGLSNITHTNPLAKTFIRIGCGNIYHIFLD